MPLRTVRVPLLRQELSSSLVPRMRAIGALSARHQSSRHGPNHAVRSATEVAGEGLLAPWAALGAQIGARPTPSDRREA